MEECVVNEEYTKILFDEIFLKTVTVRTSSPENNINLLRAYDILLDLGKYLSKNNKQKFMR